MKKILLLLLLTLFSIQSFSQTRLKRNYIEVDTLVNNYWFIYRGDTILFNEFSAVQFSADTTNWHEAQVLADKYFRIKAADESYYRYMKIWDGRTLDLNTFNVINVDTAVNPLDAVNYVLLKDTAAA